MDQEPKVQPFVAALRPMTSPDHDPWWFAPLLYAGLCLFAPPMFSPRTRHSPRCGSTATMECKMREAASALELSSHLSIGALGSSGGLESPPTMGKPRCPPPPGLSAFLASASAWRAPRTSTDSPSYRGDRLPEYAQAAWAKAVLRARARAAWPCSLPC
jgi:hypothetical protein